MGGRARILPMTASKARRPAYAIIAGHAAMALLVIVLATLTVTAAERRLAAGMSLSAVQAANLAQKADAAPPRP